MADQRITELNELLVAASSDVLAIVDVSASAGGSSTGETKKITASNLIDSSLGLLSAGAIDLNLLNQSSTTKIGTTALADNSITYAKIQDLSATDKLLGRSTAGAGDVEEIDCTAAGRALIAGLDAAAQRTTLGLGTTATLTFGSVTADVTSTSVAITGGTITGITDLAIADGGTGASDAATARQNLGTEIGVDVQAYDAGLASIAGLTTAADQSIYLTAADTYDAYALTAAGRALLDDADAAAQRTTLGLGTLATQSGTFSGTHSGTSSGTNTGDQTITLTGAVSGSGTGSFATTLGTGVVGTTNIASDAVTYDKLQDTTTNNVILGRSTTGGGTIEEIACTAQGRALINDDTAADQRSTLGLGDLAIATGTWVNGSSFSGTSSGINTGDQTITLTGAVTGSGTGSFATTLGTDVVIAANIQANAVITSKINDSAADEDKLGSAFASFTSIKEDSDIDDCNAS